MIRKSTTKGFAEHKTSYRASRSGKTDAEEITKIKRKLPAPETLPDGTVRYFLVAGPKGRVLLPADMRATMDLQEGDVITAWLKNGEVRMHSHLNGLRKIQAEALSMKKGNGYASDELLAERRAEAAKEAEETIGERRAHKKKRR